MKLCGVKVYSNRFLADLYNVVATDPRYRSLFDYNAPPPIGAGEELTISYGKGYWGMNGDSRSYCSNIVSKYAKSKLKTHKDLIVYYWACGLHRIKFRGSLYLLTYNAETLYATSYMQI